MNEIIDTLNRRYATKKFDTTKKVSDSDLNIILESLRLSASSFGLEPRKFIIVKNQDIKEELTKQSFGQTQPTDCSHLIVLCAKTDINQEYIDEFLQNIATTRGQTVEDLKNGYGAFLAGHLKDKSPEWIQQRNTKQVYIALGMLLFACAQLRIDSCAMEGFLPQEYSRVLGLDTSGYTPVVVCPIGYRAEDDKYAQLPKVRFSKDKIIEIIN